jgi:UDP-glucuronate 4-epimerase
MNILVTGVAGFIGFHAATRLLAHGHTVLGIDNLNDYYSTALKQARLAQLAEISGFTFRCLDLAHRAGIEALFEEFKPQRVLHLGAQAGVRYSLQNPHAYIESNVVGFLHILEGCRQHGTEHLVYASSSSVYGLNETMPYRVQDNVDHPISLYAATKKSNELMAHTYSHLYRLPTTGLRFFTVYGPWGRPDMAYWKFTEAILEGRPIEVYAMGQQQRDFTYIDDIVEGVTRLLAHYATPNLAWTGSQPDTSTSQAPYRVYNIGNSAPVPLLNFISTIEECLGKKATLVMLPAQPGDVIATGADVEPLREAVGFVPHTSLTEGLHKFVAWYQDYRQARP